MSELDVSEFADGEDEILDKKQDNTANDDAMAPTFSLEPVIVVRPIKVLAIISAVVAAMFFGLAIAASEWVKGEGKQEGLWAECFDVGNDTIECFGNMGTNRVWMSTCRFLMLLSVCVVIIGMVICSVGVNTVHFERKPKYYNVSMGLLFIATIPAIVTLILFPVKFVEENNPSSWTIGWSYVIGWLATALTLLASILICVDRNADEEAYREVTCYHNDTIEDCE